MPFQAVAAEAGCLGGGGSGWTGVAPPVTPPGFFSHDRPETTGVPRPAAHAASTRVIGLVGWSGAGKTTLLTALLPLLTKRGLRVSTVKHTHHAFEVDVPGKDSWKHRQAGAAEVLVASAHRWALIHESRGEQEPALPELLERLSPCDLVVVEGHKWAALPKMEIWREATGKPPLHTEDPSIAIIASDDACPAARVPVISLSDLPALADALLAAARPIGDIIHDLKKRADGPAL